MRNFLAAFLFLVCALENSAGAQVSCRPGFSPTPGVSSLGISGLSEICGGGRSTFVSQLPPGAIGVWSADTLTGASSVASRSPPPEHVVWTGDAPTNTFAADTPNSAPLVVPAQLSVVAPPRTIITNQITNGPADPNLLSGPRRLFTASNTFGWGRQGVTLTDANQAAADGSNDASTATSWNSWAITPFGKSNIPPGTYTVGVCVKYGGSGPASFNPGESGSVLGMVFGCEVALEIAHAEMKAALPASVGKCPISRHVGLRTRAGVSGRWDP
jgi:hypothetical protein